jgi:hypothetical protein
MSDIYGFVKAYAICWRGKFLRKVGNSYNRGFEWANSVADARMYGSEAELDKHLLAVARECPNGGPWPEVMEFRVTHARTVDHSARFEKNRERALKAEATRQANWNKVRQTDAQREIERLEAQLKYAKERAGL